MSVLVPCPACRRHGRQSEGTCSFCGAELSQAAPAAGEWTHKLKRVSAMVAVIGGLGGCTTGTGAEPPYGAPPPEPDMMPEPDPDGGDEDDEDPADGGLESDGGP